MKNRHMAKDLLTSKDLDYLKDIFNWHLNIYKLNENVINNIKDNNIIQLFNKCNLILMDNINIVIDILERNLENE